MKTKILSVLALGAAVMFTSCDDNWTLKTEKEGQVDLSGLLIEVDSAVQAVEGSSAASSGVKSREAIDLSDYKVNVYNAAGEVEESWRYADMPEIFTLPVGQGYYVKVVSHDVKKAAWEEPLYSGESEKFDIENGKITAVGTVTCRFASLKVTVQFSDDLLAVMDDDYTVQVNANDEGSLVFDKTTISQAGYFEVVEGSTTLAYYFNGTVKGQREEVYGPFVNIAPGQHRIIKFTLKENTSEPDPEVGDIKPGEGINIDVNVENENLDGSLSAGEEDNVSSTRPGENYQEAVNVAYDQAATALTVQAGNGISSLLMAISSDNSEALSAFSAVASIDLASASASAAAAYGLPYGDAVAAQKALTINLATLIDALKEYEGQHSIDFTASDGDKTASASVAVKGKTANPVIDFETELDKENPMVLTEENAESYDGKVYIYSEFGIEDLIVRIDTDSPNFALTLRQMLSLGDNDPIEFNLAHPTDIVRQSFGPDGLGLKLGDEVLHQSDVLFDITSFIPLLNIYPGATDTFSIRVIDVNGNEETLTLTFDVQ